MRLRGEQEEKLETEAQGIKEPRMVINLQMCAREKEREVHNCTPSLSSPGISVEEVSVKRPAWIRKSFCSKWLPISDGIFQSCNIHTSKPN